MKLRALTGTGGKRQLREQVENGFSNLPAGCYVELQKVARDYILENLRQTDNRLKALIEQVRTFEADTGRELTLANFLDEYGLSLYEFYSNNGARSLNMLKRKAGLVESTNPEMTESEKRSFSAMTGLFHINSPKLLDYWIRYIEDGLEPRTEEERLMRNMLYYTFFNKHPAKMGFRDIDDGIASILQPGAIRDEALEILHYKRDHISFVAGKNEYPFACPLELHCQYNTPQIMAAFDFFNETQSPEFREGVKYFAEKATDIFLINLNKTEKEFSPSTMYDDYAISAQLFNWQSQSHDRDTSAKIQRYIHHQETGNTISLFVREYKRNGSYTAAYMFLGNADYVSHKGSQPVTFVWKLHKPIPADLRPKANKTIAM